MIAFPARSLKELFDGFSVDRRRRFFSDQTQKRWDDINVPCGIDSSPFVDSDTGEEHYGIVFWEAAMLSAVFARTADSVTGKRAYRQVAAVVVMATKTVEGWAVEEFGAFDGVQDVAGLLFFRFGDLAEIDEAHAVVEDDDLGVGLELGSSRRNAEFSIAQSFLGLDGDVLFFKFRHAMVGSEGDGRLVVDALLFQAFDETANGGVDGDDSAFNVCAVRAAAMTSVVGGAVNCADKDRCVVFAIG